MHFEFEVEVFGVLEEGEEGGESEGDEGMIWRAGSFEDVEEEGGEEGVDDAVTLYSQSCETATCPYSDAPATRTVTVPLTGTVYVFETVLT